MVERPGYERMLELGQSGVNVWAVQSRDIHSKGDKSGRHNIHYWCVRKLFGIDGTTKPSSDGVARQMRFYLGSFFLHLIKPSSWWLCRNGFACRTGVELRSLESRGRWKCGQNYLAGIVSPWWFCLNSILIFVYFCNSVWKPRVVVDINAKLMWGKSGDGKPQMFEHAPYRGDDPGMSLD